MSTSLDFRELCDFISAELLGSMNTHLGLAIFARERAKFEGWLKVEIVKILSRRFPDVVPEKNRIDITFSDWAVELKTVNTSIRYPNVKKKTRPITKNVQKILGDIRKLGNVKQKNRAVVFVVFPVKQDNAFWNAQLSKITYALKEIQAMDFVFSNDVPGVLYFGQVK